MGWLKGAVIGMAVLIAIGMGLLVYGVVTKTGPKSAGSEPQPTSSRQPKAFGTVTVPLPDGCQVQELAPDGERVYLLIGPVETPACDMTIVVDASTGRTLGTLRFRP